MNYAMTPYNFIPFPEYAVYRYKGVDNLPSHFKIEKKDDDNKKIFSGSIKYTIKTKDLMFINDGNDNFFKINDKFAIPGSTIKGLIRKNASILSYSKPEFIEDRTLWYRGLADESKRLRKQYDKKLKDSELNHNNNVEDGVSAGYIKKINNKYKIIEAKSHHEKSYKPIKEAFLRNMTFNNQNTDKYFMYSDDIDWSKVKELKDEGNIDDAEKELSKYKRNFYKPYQISVYYKIKENGYVEDISLNNKKGYENGYLVNSNNLGNKKVHYLIFSKDLSRKKKNVSYDVIKNFKVNVKYSQINKENLFNLDFSKENEKVVFYKTNNGSVDVIGFTPYLKIPYDHSISKGIKTDFYRNDNEDDLEKYDYVKSIFGFTSDKVNYKSRVTFDNLLVKEKYNSKKYLYGSINKTLESPSPKSFQIYLKQNQKDYLINYNDDFELKGYKFYYLKENVDKKSEPKKDFNT
ncbi:MAG: TIGR03986 family type III CRISPR-associated RAMP protein, partial [Bacillota bacterium]